MRLIDADALMTRLDAFSSYYSPNDNDSLYEHDRKFAILDGLGLAKAAVREVPTVYASDWMNEMMMEDERLKKEQNDDTDTEDSAVSE